MTSIDNMAAVKPSGAIAELSITEIDEVGGAILPALGPAVWAGIVATYGPPAAWGAGAAFGGGITLAAFLKVSH